MGMFCLFRNWWRAQDELHTDQREVPLYSSEACHPFRLEIVWKRDSFSSGTMALNRRWLCAGSVWSPGKSKECWHAWLSLHSHQTSTSTEHLWEYLKRQKVKATLTSQDFRWDVLRKTAWMTWILIFFKNL